MYNKKKATMDSSVKPTSSSQSLGFDNTDNARYESMRNQVHRGRLLRRHQDLDRACERRLHLYDRCMEHFTTDVDKSKAQLESRLQRLISNSTDKSKSFNGVQPTLNNNDNKTVLLFSIIHKDGEEIYINRLNQNNPDNYRTVSAKREIASEQKTDESFITERRVSASPLSERGNDRKRNGKRKFLIRELTM